MEESKQIRVTDAVRIDDDNVQIVFTDGTSYLYNAALLHSIATKAKETTEPEPAPTIHL